MLDVSPPEARTTRATVLDVPANTQPSPNVSRHFDQAASRRRSSQMAAIPSSMVAASAVEAS